MTAKTAIEARLAANWSHSVIFGPNAEGEPPTDGSPYVLVQYPVAAEENHVGLGGVGNRTFREEGGFRVVLHIQRSKGVTEGRAWIEELRSLFRAAQFDGVSCTTVSNAAENDSSENGNYYLLSFAVTYYFDILA